MNRDIMFRRHRRQQLIGRIVVATIKYAAAIALGGVLMFLFLRYVVAPSLIKQEEVYCLKLESQSKEFRNFFITNVDKEMCDSHGINIDPSYVVDITSNQDSE